MAIYHLTVNLVQRSQAQSLVAKAAYMTGEKLKEERTGTVKYYRDTDDRVIYHSITRMERGDLQSHLTAWDKSERRKDALTAISYEGALPNEWDLETCKEALEKFLPAGSVYAIHWNDGNHHFHALRPMRDFDPETGEFAKKKMRTSPKLLSEFTLAERERWEHVENSYLDPEKHVSCKSLKAQGKDQEPTIHEGYTAREIDAWAVSERVEHNKAVKELNSAKAKQRLIQSEKSYIIDRLEKIIAEAREHAKELLKPFTGVFRSWKNTDWNRTAVFDTETGEREVTFLDGGFVSGVLTAGEKYDVTCAEKDGDVVAASFGNDNFQLDFDLENESWSEDTSKRFRSPSPSFEQIQELQHSRGIERTR